MRKITPYLIILIFLMACNSADLQQPSPASTTTAIVASLTETSKPLPVNTATSTLTPTPMWTLTPSPSSTPTHTPTPEPIAAPESEFKEDGASWMMWDGYKYEELTMPEGIYPVMRWKAISEEINYDESVKVWYGLNALGQAEVKIVDGEAVKYERPVGLLSPMGYDLTLSDLTWDMLKPLDPNEVTRLTADGTNIEVVNGGTEDYYAEKTPASNEDGYFGLGYYFTQEWDNENYVDQVHVSGIYVGSLNIMDAGYPVTFLAIKIPNPMSDQIILLKQSIYSTLQKKLYGVEDNGRVNLLYQKPMNSAQIIEMFDDPASLNRQLVIALQRTNRNNNSADVLVELFGGIKKGEAVSGEAKLNFLTMFWWWDLMKDY